ncbi:hypothetical protein NNJEOMEG_01482 [Fundidesulfovibrio magnetotacticus]|uniref:ABC-type sugar transport system, periplasmic component n=1 Tax=Fundidesulfovibrio magnetotacticus TaxID=2730080 RepID=A0A6V8LTJ8_9BACT|nr:ABC transporter substrate binding protein [Fundidesulfovibrio magnetotacticus]GFK93648.1 hypothetical protein NNJEOMEG_01482 [Fundidesulfovibrio magnetotacticus]
MSPNGRSSTVPALVLAGLLLCLAAPSPAQTPRAETPLRVFVVQSYNQEYVWTRTINEGLREALRGLDVVIEFFYLDAKRKPDPDNLRRVAREALARIEARRPQVVVAVDDPAQAYLVEPFLKGRASPQVIFCGVNAPLALYGYPAANVSGVRERWHFREGFAFLRQLFPDVGSVALLLDESESAGFVLDDLREDQRLNGPFAVRLAAVEQVATFQAWRRKVLELQERADALALGLYHSLVDEETGLVVPPEQVAAWNDTVVRKPTLGFTDFSRDHGHLAGVLESGHEQGFLAGGMVREILTTRVAAGTLPVRINDQGIVFLNLRTAERLGLKIPYEFIEAGEVVVR